MFIEVKHFGEQPGKFGLTAYELKRAKEAGDQYYVYIVTGLKEDDLPTKLYIIQNPTKWLIPDPPTDEAYSKWQTGVSTEIEFDRA